MISWGPHPRAPLATRHGKPTRSQPAHPTRPRPASRALAPASADAYAEKLAGLKKRGQLERLIKFVRSQKPRGGTNLHGALVEAMGDKRADTVFVLSDGAPSAGAITDPTALVDDILRRNRTRKIVFHCISIGTKIPLLERLVRETGGQYPVH